MSAQQINCCIRLVRFMEIGGYVDHTESPLGTLASTKVTVFGGYGGGEGWCRGCRRGAGPKQRPARSGRETIEMDEGEARRAANRTEGGRVTLEDNLNRSRNCLPISLTLEMYGRVADANVEGGGGPRYSAMGYGRWAIGLCAMCCVLRCSVRLWSGVVGQMSGLVGRTSMDMRRQRCRSASDKTGICLLQTSRRQGGRRGRTLVLFGFGGGVGEVQVGCGG